MAPRRTFDPAAPAHCGAFADARTIAAAETAHLSKAVQRCRARAPPIGVSSRVVRQVIDARP